MYLTLEKHSHNMKEDFKPNYLFAKLYSGLPVKTCVKINKMTLIDLFEYRTRSVRDPRTLFLFFLGGCGLYQSADSIRDLLK